MSFQTTNASLKEANRINRVGIRSAKKPKFTGRKPHKRLMYNKVEWLKRLRSMNLWQDPSMIALYYHDIFCNSRVDKIACTFIDHRGRVLRSDDHVGTVGTVILSPRLVATAALECEAAGVIFGLLRIRPDQYPCEPEIKLLCSFEAALAAIGTEIVGALTFDGERMAPIETFARDRQSEWI